MKYKCLLCDEEMIFTNRRDLCDHLIEDHFIVELIEDE